jgi:tetratricopeptide (TPR) repeat protein
MAKNKQRGGDASNAAPANATATPFGDDTLAAIVDRLRNGRCVLCAGSRLAESPYSSLVAKLFGALPDVDAGERQRVLDKRPLAAAGFVRRRLGDAFAGELQKAAAGGETIPEAVQLLGELPFRAVVTTTYGDAFERAFTRDGAAPRVYTPSDHVELKKDGKARFVFKALGDPQRPGTVVWSAEDLQGALADGGYRTVAQDLFRSRSFLFVGFEGQDPDLGILLERVLSGARSSDVEHWAVLPGLTEIEKEELWAAYRIRVLDGAPSDVAALAKLLKEHLGDQLGPVLPDDDDLEGWLALLEEDPTRADARDRLNALDKKLRELGDFERLIELNLGRVGVEPDAATRGAMLLEVARIFENEIGDLQKAFTALLAAYKEDPQPSAWAELERLASATGMWTELLSELAEIVPAMNEAERPAAWVRIARLYGDKLGHVEYALTSVEEALKQKPEGATLAEAQELRIGLLRRAERWKDLADALGLRAAMEDGAALKCEMLLEQADLLESRLGDTQGAIAAYRMALEADPSSDDARAALEALLRRSGAFRELIPILDEKARMASPEEAVLIRREAAELLAERLGDRKAAIERYEALRAEAPRDLVMLRALERLYREEGRDDDTLRVLGQQADAVESDKERAALFRRLATEWEEHPGGAPRAAEYLEKLLVLDGKSEDAFRSLERIYRNDHRWQELVETYNRHAAIVPTALRGELFAQVGAIYEVELKDPARAIEAYLNVDQAIPNHTEALVALSRLYERTEAWERAVEVLERRAALAEVRSQKVELYHKAGELTAERIGDAKAAEARFMKALELDATYVPAMTALVEIYRKNGEFLKAAKLLIEAVPHTQNRLEKTRILVEAAEIYEGLEDTRKATELYLEALGVDPEHVEAGERVAELLWSAQKWAELIPVLEMLTRSGKAAQAEPHVQLERLLRLGRAAKALGDFDKAQKAFGRAAEVDPTSLEAQRGRAELPYERGDWKEAAAAFALVEKHHGMDLPPSERVELFHRLGRCEKMLDNKSAARAWFQKALEIDPSHRETLLAMVEVIDQAEAKPESLIDAKKALLPTASIDEQVRLLTEIGDLYLDKVQDPAQAVASWREALELRPENQRLLFKCMEVYSEQKQWQPALEMLERLIAVEKTQAVRAKFRHAAGLIAKDELGKPELAAKLLAEALDDDPTLERSAVALEELLRDRQEWKELARFYRKALKRLGADGADDPKKNAERLRLWSALGEICLEKLGERESALAALEVALTFDAGNLDRHKQLADLYVEAGPDRADKAITEHQHILRSEKNRIASYRALKNLYLSTGQRDKAAACSYALTFLKKGEADDQKLVAELKARPMAQARRALNDEMWARLQHPDEDRTVAALFAMIGPLVALGSAQPHKTHGLNRKEALDPADPRPTPFAKTVRYVASTLALGATTPEVYVRKEQAEAIAYLSCSDKNALVPVMLAGAPLLNDKRAERELVYEVARRMAMFRPERLLRLALPDPGAIAHIVDAAVAIAAEKDSGKADLTGELGKTVAGLKRLFTPVQLEQVAAVGRRLRGRGSVELATAWVKATDLTGLRAGLVLAGDLETAARLVAAEPQSASTLPTVQRLLDLVWSSVTEDIFAVRKHLGLV